MPVTHLLLHNIRSTHNVGSILRTADGFGVTSIVFSGYTPYPRLTHDTRLPHIIEKLSNQIHKTALGAERSLSLEYVVDLDAWISSTDLRLVALEQSDDSQDIRTYEVRDNIVLVVGEEVDGIDTTLLARCDDIVEIPMSGMKESFNVSAATAIALYQLTAASHNLRRTP